MSGDNHPNKLEENRKKISEGLKALGENHHSKRPEHRERARQLFLGDNNPNKSPEGRERCRKRMLDPERNALAREKVKEIMAKRIRENPNCQSEAAKKCHEKKDEKGRSLHGLMVYNKNLANVPKEVLQEYARILNETKYYDPDHPELGERSAGSLARMQKARGYPHGPENRVKVTIKEEP
jgi:hypothetical protein